MKLVVTSGENTTVFERNNSSAAKDLWAQLPLSIAVNKYGKTEMIFYPPTTLDVTDTPLADAQEGTLAYYAPWGDVVMFYEGFGRASGLYALGHVISGGEQIPTMSGKIRVERATPP